MPKQICQIRNGRCGASSGPSNAYQALLFGSFASGRGDARRYDSAWLACHWDLPFRYIRWTYISTSKQDQPPRNSTTIHLTMSEPFHFGVSQTATQAGFAHPVDCKPSHQTVAAPPTAQTPPSADEGRASPESTPASPTSPTPPIIQAAPATSHGSLWSWTKFFKGGKQ